jgi:flagellar biosynthesis anti-sigma factor FlgM
LESPAEATDCAQLSGHINVQSIKAQVLEMPDVREDRVQTLRKAIQTGEYRIDFNHLGAALAKHMISGPFS